MKKSVLVLLGLALLTILSTSGIKKLHHPDGTTIVGQTTGCSCHKGKAGVVTLTVGNPVPGAHRTVKPNSTYPITFVYNVGIANTYQYWGLDIRASSLKQKGSLYGTLGVTAGDGMVVSSGEVVHSTPINGGTASKTAGSYSYPGITYNTTGLTAGTSVYFSFAAAVGPTLLTQGGGSSGTVYDQVGLDTIDVVAGLPVEFASFNAVWAGGNKINLNWKTATETGSSFFEVERSADGETFAPVSRIPAVGNSIRLTSYSATDATSLSGTVYYRIKETDADGAISYTAISAVKINPVVDYVKSVFPNPSMGNQPVHIKYVATGDAKVNIELYNCLGRKMNSVSVNVVSGENDINFSLGRFISPGIYYLTVTNGADKVAQLPLSVQ